MYAPIAPGLGDGIDFGVAAMRSVTHHLTSFVSEVTGATVRSLERGEHVIAPLLALTSYVGVGVPLRLWLNWHRTDPHQAAIVIGGVHIHHEVIGAALLVTSGFLATDELIPHLRAVAFGAGAVLVLDETLLLIELDPDDYWRTANMVALGGGIALLLGNWLLARRFYKEVAAIAVKQTRGTVGQVSAALAEADGGLE